MDQVTDKVITITQQQADRVIELIIAIAAILKNPVGAAIATAVGSVLGWIVLRIIKKKIHNAEVDHAQQETEKGHQDQIEHRIPETVESNEKDNAGRSKLDQLK